MKISLPWSSRSNPEVQTSWTAHARSFADTHETHASSDASSIELRQATKYCSNKSFLPLTLLPEYSLVSNAPKNVSLAIPKTFTGEFVGVTHDKARAKNFWLPSERIQSLLDNPKSPLRSMRGERARLHHDFYADSRGHKVSLYIDTLLEGRGGQKWCELLNTVAQIFYLRRIEQFGFSRSFSNDLLQNTEISTFFESHVVQNVSLHNTQHLRCWKFNRPTRVTKRHIKVLPTPHLSSSLAKKMGRSQVEWQKRCVILSAFLKRSSENLTCPSPFLPKRRYLEPIQNKPFIFAFGAFDFPKVWLGPR